MFKTARHALFYLDL